MTKSAILQRLLDPGIIAIIRADSSEQLVEAAGALLEGGITAMEVTMTTPNALAVITAVAQKFGDQILIGVGTVTDPVTARAAVAAGAEFIVTPRHQAGSHCRSGNQLDKSIASGAFTPTECLLAHESGADFVKLFPCRTRRPRLHQNPPRPAPHAPHRPHRRSHPRNRRRLPPSRLRRPRRRLLPSSPRKSSQNRDWPTLTQRSADFIAAVRKFRF